MIDDVHCNNYEICETEFHPEWLRCFDKGICINCDVVFGKTLIIYENTECPICYETTRSVEHPRCKHTTCISCFKRCQYGDETGEPIFPYPEIEDEYDGDPENDKWRIEYPLISVWVENWNTWDDNREDGIHSKCSLCRK